MAVVAKNAGRNHGLNQLSELLHAAPSIENYSPSWGGQGRQSLALLRRAKDGFNGSYLRFSPSGAIAR